MTAVDDLFVELNARVACGGVHKHRTRGSEAARVLVEQDVTLILDELALLEDAVHLSPATGPALELNPSLS